MKSHGRKKFLVKLYETTRNYKRIQSASVTNAGTQTNPANGETVKISGHINTQIQIMDKRVLHTVLG